MRIEFVKLRPSIRCRWIPVGMSLVGPLLGIVRDGGWGASFGLGSVGLCWGVVVGWVMLDCVTNHIVDSSTTWPTVAQPSPGWPALVRAT